MLLKKRQAKKSVRGIYLQDKELKQTVFQPGQNYKYVVDVASRKIVILSSQDASDNVVSKRQVTDGEKPVIDIRSKEALSVFAGADYLQVEIFQDQIVVEGFVQESAGFLTKAVHEVKKAFRKAVPATDITQLLSVKQKARVVFSQKELEKAVSVGGVREQLTFDFGEYGKAYSSDQIEAIQSRLKNVKIPLDVVSLFAGAGVLDQGFVEAGFQIILAVENDTDAVKTYRANHGDTIIEADMIEIDKNTLPKAPVMIGGGSCKPFSNSNRQETRLLNHPDFTLVRAFIDSVKANKNCKVFVYENVPPILTACDGQIRKEFYEELSDFEITSDVLCAADYGSAQMRHRAIFIGSTIGKIDLPKPEFKAEEYTTVYEAFQGLHNGIPNQLDYSVAKDITKERMRHVPAGGNVFDIPEAIRPGGVHSDMYRRLEWDKPSITIVNPRKSMILHPEEDRIISVREGARLLGLADQYIFRGKLGSMQQQIANAVPVELARAIGKVIKEAVMRFNITQRHQAYT